MSITAPVASLAATETMQHVPQVARARPKCTGGALPFKKRKLAHMASASSPPVVSMDLTRPAPVPIPTQDDDRAAALALLAAASGALTMVVPAEPEAPTQIVGSLMALSRAAEAAERTSSPPNAVMSSLSFQGCQPVGPPPVTPCTPMGTTEITPSLPLSANNSVVASKPRMHHPPLASPLPGGCHGRTSRNNSFCRRTPCYNGSSYCKLHYQQYVVAGTRVPVHPGTTVTVQASVTNTPVSTAHQDKRFTGCGDEPRCAATTTRGRACAYVAVDDTKFCHLHSDYATNPPPRRGGGSTGSKPRLLSKSSLDILPRVQGCPTMPDLGGGKRFSLTAPLKPTLMPLGPDSFRQSPPSVSVSSDESFTLPTNSQSPSHVLLSSISSDQWLNRKVLIATGPLVNRTGTVEKWGNGWVTVRVRDGLTHNRRSVELFLLPEDASVSSDEETSPRAQSAGLPLSVSFHQSGKQELVAPPKIEGFEKDQPRFSLPSSVSFEKQHALHPVRGHDGATAPPPHSAQP